jgi:hydroxyethylthiazole kinase-like uncharacterized protein yjeF
MKLQVIDFKSLKWNGVAPKVLLNNLFKKKVESMYIVSAEEMRKLDHYTIQTIGIPAAVLMENAGRSVAEVVENLAHKLPGSRSDKPWLILTGKGNNGGDGLVAARHLHEMGIGAEILYATGPEAMTGDAALQRDIIQKLGITTTVFVPGSLAMAWHRYAGIVDALLGTGTNGAPREPYASLIREANRSGLPIVAIDIPSGLNANTGEVGDPCIRAKVTVALAYMKIGLTQYPGSAYSGVVMVRNIGIPERLAHQQQVCTYWADQSMFLKRFGLELPLVREANTHKGTYGHAIIVAGSRKYSGAGLLTATAALRSGAGLVTWALPERLLDAVVGRVPEVMLAGVSDNGAGNWSETSPDEVLKLAECKDALAIGPGLDRFAGDDTWLRKLWSGAECPIVLDADALNMIADAGGLDSWPRRDRPAILTPHPGEMARLIGRSVREVECDRIGLARVYAKQHGVTLVLKGARTVTATPNGDVFVNTTGNSGMATGGAGDVLTGIIISLLAQGFDAGLAAALGVYMHGAAGDRAAALRHSPASLIAGDIIEQL